MSHIYRIVFLARYFDVFDCSTGFNRVEFSDVFGALDLKLITLIQVVDELKLLLETRHLAHLSIPQFFKERE